jgi:hypothetical protein
MTLSDVQSTIQTRLEADTAFTDISVVTEKIGDIQSKIDQGLAKLNLAVVVLTPGAQLIDDEGRAACRLRVTCTVTVIEKPTTNNKGKSCLALVADVIRVLHASSGTDGKSDRIFLTSDALRTLPDPTGLFVYAVNFYMDVSIV